MVESRPCAKLYLDSQSSLTFYCRGPRRSRCQHNPFWDEFARSSSLYRALRVHVPLVESIGSWLAYPYVVRTKYSRPEFLRPRVRDAAFKYNGFHAERPLPWVKSASVSKRLFSLLSFFFFLKNPPPPPPQADTTHTAGPPQ